MPGVFPGVGPVVGSGVGPGMRPKIGPGVGPDRRTGALPWHHCQEMECCCGSGNRNDANRKNTFSSIFFVF